MTKPKAKKDKFVRCGWGVFWGRCLKEQSSVEAVCHGLVEALRLDYPRRKYHVEPIFRRITKNEKAEEAKE